METGRHLGGSCNNTNGKVEETIGYPSEDFWLDIGAACILWEPVVYG